MGIFSRLGLGSSQTPKTIKPGVGAFTTGGEEILMSLPGIAFTPPAGWSPFESKLEQKPTDVRIASPTLMRKDGMMITCLFFPPDGLALVRQVDNFLSRAKDQLLERKEIISTNGIPVTFLHAAGAPAPGKAQIHMMYCWFMNGVGQVVSLYTLGSEASARATSDAILRTLRFV